MIDSLAGLSVGDALGAQYFMVGRKVSDLMAGVVPPPVWEWTDDTEMATGRQCGWRRYFAGAPQDAVEEAAKSARVTHMHPEGIAVAVAACHAAAGG